MLLRKIYSNVYFHIEHLIKEDAAVLFASMLKIKHAAQGSSRGDRTVATLCPIQCCPARGMPRNRRIRDVGAMGPRAQRAILVSAPFIPLES